MCLRICPGLILRFFRLHLPRGEMLIIYPPLYSGNFCWIHLTFLQHWHTLYSSFTSLPSIPAGLSKDKKTLKGEVKLMVVKYSLEPSWAVGGAVLQRQ